MAENKKKSVWEAYRFSIILVGAILIGSLIGIKMGPRASMFKPLGDLFINGMFMVVVPLVFVTISGSISAMSDMARLGKNIKKFVACICFNWCSSCCTYTYYSKYFSTCKGSGTQHACS